MLDENLIEALKNPIHDVWEQIYEDCGFVHNNAGALEMAVDADRLAMFSTKEANELFKAACKEHGYDAVFAYLEKNIRVYT